MKQNVLNLLFILLIALCATAAAEKARFLAEDGDRAYHGRHLALHAGTEDCRICGNYLKVRAWPDGNAAVVGHAEQADLVHLLEISGKWARIRVVYSAQSSPDSWTGLEGWVDAAYLECGCSERTYYAGGVDGAQGGEITAGSVNLRETASAKSRSLGKLERGERVRVLGQYGKGAKTFYRVVRSSGQSGFVSAEYLKVGGNLPEMAYASPGRERNPSSGLPDYGTASTGLDLYTGTEELRATTGQLRVRKTPDGEIIGHISPDDSILLQELKGEWARIKVTNAKSWYEDCWTGLEGWVSTEFLRNERVSPIADKQQYKALTKETLFPSMKGMMLDFSSGAGAWQTELCIKENGEFYGEYEDADMGVYTEDYPGGTIYECRFSGKLSIQSQLSDYSWQLHIDKLKIENSHDTEYIEKGVLHVPSKPYGIEDTEVLILYTPGMPVSEVSESFLSWAGMYESEERLYGFAIYNPVHGYAFR